MAISLVLQLPKLAVFFHQILLTIGNFKPKAVHVLTILSWIEGSIPVSG